MFLLADYRIFLAKASLTLFFTTYFVVAHFHLVLSLGAVVGAFAGFYFFFHVNQKQLNMYVHKSYYFCFCSILFVFPLHYLGLFGFHEVTDYPFTHLNTNILFIGHIFVRQFLFFMDFFFFFFKKRTTKTHTFRFQIF